jgi:hypothetical protein
VRGGARVNQTDELALVIELACQTADRSPQEQRALLATALRVDVQRSRLVIGNPNPVRPYLFEQAVETYDPDGGKPVRPAKGQLAKLNRRHATFDDYEQGRGDWQLRPFPETVDVETEVI